MTLLERLTKDEDFRPRPYFDCCGKFFRECKCLKQGKLTIGIGRNIEDCGVSKDEAVYLARNDIDRSTFDADKSFPWFHRLDSDRQDVVISMIFNMGLGGFKEFKKMISAIALSKWDVAASEMLNSSWSAQTKRRAVDLAQMMRGPTV